MRPRAIHLVMLIALVALSSCHRRLAMVEALSSDGSYLKTYYLVPGNRGV